ncbi:MAG: T9SS type A sorting domain-containing protein, partial [Crocinitomicaceae bacterium]|nr:T9SS type A sorting domain-containing protein [Crocinitomicaceae bacterium]
PTQLMASATATEILCNGETTDITVVASGGTAPYTGTGVYTESAGTYTYTVTDANGCSVDVTITVTESTQLMASATATEILCNGETTDITVVASGGTAPYTGTGVYTESAGTYTYTVTDSKGCSVDVTITVTEPTQLTASATATEILCNGETTDITVVASGGTAPYTGTGVYTESAGTYTYTVTDSKGCSVDVTITVTEPTLLVASATATEILCNGETTDITVTATGGTAPYTGNITYTESAGTYTYTVTDSKGCTSDVTITVTEPTVLTASATATQILCNGETTDITVVGSGGTAPYTGDGVYTELAGTYTYTVTDANGCTADVTITVTEPTQLELDLAGCSIVYGGLGWAYACATIDGTASEGTPAYSYAWSTGEATPSITVCPDSTTTYSLTVTDGLGCTVTETWTVEVVDIICSNNGSSSSSGSSSNSGSGSNSNSGSNSGSGSGSGSNSNSGSGGSSCDANSGSGSGSGSGSNSNSGSSSSSASGPTYPSAPSCPSSASSSNSGSASGSNDSNSGSGSGSSNSGSNSSSGSSSSSVSSCSLPSDGSSNCSGGGSSSSNSGSGNSINNNTSVLMCFNGVTYCVKYKNVDKKLACGYTLGPCDMQQSAACDNSVPTDTLAGASCVCSGRLASITVRYIGPANGAVNASAKSCGSPISSTSGLNTGAIFYVNASDGGLQYLRNTTYLEVAGSSNGTVAIPTNCCNNPVGQTSFPFQIIGWVDTQGNTCGTVDNGGGINSLQTTIGQADRDSQLKVKKATISQFPNPASTNATFEFTVPASDVVTVSIVNIRGELIGTIFSEEIEAERTYSVSHDVSELQSGIYFVHMNTSEGVIKKKFVVLK